MPIAPPVFPEHSPTFLRGLTEPAPPQLCEVRVDVPLPRDESPAAWERAWRIAMAKGRLTALASGGAAAVTARVQVCLSAGASADALAHFLPTRLRALPGSPTVLMETPLLEGNWRGVRVWLAFASNALPVLLRRPKKPFNPFVKGRSR